MPISSASVGRKVGILMNDIDAGAEFERTTVNEIARFINEGCLKIVRMKPTELSARVSMKLLPGSTRQGLVGAEFLNLAGDELENFTPLQLLSVARNMGDDGITPGRACVTIDQKNLDVMLPDWHTRDSEGFIRWVMFDPNDPLSFQVCYRAPDDDDLFVEVLCSRAPVNTLLDTAVALGDNDIDAGLAGYLEEALVEWVAHRALTKDGTSPVNDARAAGRLQAFGQVLGIEIANDRTYHPRTRRPREASEG